MCTVGLRHDHPSHVLAVPAHPMDRMHQPLQICNRRAGSAIIPTKLPIAGRAVFDSMFVGDAFCCAGWVSQIGRTVGGLWLSSRPLCMPLRPGSLFHAKSPELAALPLWVVPDAPSKLTNT